MFGDPYTPRKIPSPNYVCFFYLVSIRRKIWYYRWYQCLLYFVINELYGAVYKGVNSNLLSKFSPDFVISEENRVFIRIYNHVLRHFYLICKLYFTIKIWNMIISNSTAQDWIMKPCSFDSEITFGETEINAT